MKKISIISLGRLGREFYHLMHSENVTITGSYCHTPKNIPNEVKFCFSEDAIPTELQDSDVLLFNLTPSAIYSLQKFKTFSEQIRTQKMIFISSTSVYGMQGEVDEKTIPLPETDSGKLLLACEKLVLENMSNSTIIRPSGLYNEASHPAKYMAARELNINPNSSTNLISIEDLAGLVQKAMEQDHPIINASSIHNPSKGDYYSDYCKRNGLELPRLVGDDDGRDKIIKTLYPEFEVHTPLP